MNIYPLIARNSLSIRLSLICLLFHSVVIAGFGDDQPAQAATGQKIQASDKIGICGDGLEMPRDHAVYIQDYLQMCQPAAKLQVRVFDFGKDWKGCLQQQILPAKLNVVILIFGLGDYSPVHYKQKLTDSITMLKANGTRLIIIGTPFILDKDPTGLYAKTVADAQAVVDTVGTEQGVVVADITAAMTDAAAKAKAANSRIIIGCPNQTNGTSGGYFVIADTLLKALGCDGNIGTITLDMQANQATATDGQQISGVTNNTIDIESTRYPFCFQSANYNYNVRPVLDFIPFNQDLNRFVLVVKNAPSKKLKVTWGKKSKEFTSDDLEKGINLAAEFLDNPLLQPFADVDAKVAIQQKFQITDINLEQRSLATWTLLFPEQKETIDHLRQTLNQKIDSVVGEQEGMVAPVKHQIIIEAE